jgi:hypothetical protein
MFNIRRRPGRRKPTRPKFWNPKTFIAVLAALPPLLGILLELLKHWQK